MKELLAQRGIDENLLKVDIRESSSSFDTGEVKLQVIIPEAREKEIATSENNTEDPAEEIEPDDSAQVTESATTETVKTEQ